MKKVFTHLYYTRAEDTRTIMGNHTTSSMVVRLTGDEDIAHL